MGASIGGAILGSTITQGASSLLSNLVGIRQTNYQVHAQEEQNALNRDWQTSEAEKARNFNRSERIASQDFARDMINFQNAYDSPSSQVLRLRSAGINPQVALSGGSVQNVSSTPVLSHPATSPVPSPVGGLSPVSFQPLDLQIPQLVNSVASMIGSTAQAKKANVETGYLESAIPDMLRNLKLDADLKDVAVQMQQLDKMIKESTMPSVVRKAYNDASKAYWDAIVSKLTTGKIENESDVLVSQLKLNDALSTLHTTQGKIAALDFANYGRKLNSLLGLQSAQTSQAYASAAESSANAAVLSEEKRIRAVAADVRENGKSAELQSVLDELNAKHAISQQQYQSAVNELKRLKTIGVAYSREKDIQKVDAILENFFRIIGLHTSVSVSQ